MLCVLFWVVSVTATALIYLAVPTLSLWWCIPMLIGGFLGAIILWLILLALLTPFWAPRREPVGFCRWAIVYTCAFVTDILGYRLRLENAHLLPDVPFLLVQNHRSALDPMATLALLNNRGTVFISKPENVRIPLVGSYMRHAGFLAIDREHARKAVATIREAADHITRRGLCVGIYPEGTRSKTGHLQEFRQGAFKIATLAKAPVAVTTIRQVKPAHWYQRKLLLVRVVDVIPAGEATATAAMSQRAHAAMAEDLE